MQRYGLLGGASDIDNGTRRRGGACVDSGLGAANIAQELAVNGIDKRLVRQIDEGSKG